MDGYGLAYDFTCFFPRSDVFVPNMSLQRFFCTKLFAPETGRLRARKPDKVRCLILWTNYSISVMPRSIQLSECGRRMSNKKFPKQGTNTYTLQFYRGRRPTLLWRTQSIHFCWTCQFTKSVNSSIISSTNYGCNNYLTMFRNGWCM